MIPIAPTRDRNSTGHTERTDGRLCAAPGGSGIHAFAFLPIRYSFLYRTCLQPPSPKTVLKVFHLYRYKKSEKLSPENQIFQKKFESCRNSSQKRKIRYLTAEDQFGSVQSADKQYCTAFPVSVSSANRLPVHRKSNQQFSLHEKKRHVTCLLYAVSADFFRGNSDKQIILQSAPDRCLT